MTIVFEYQSEYLSSFAKGRCYTRVSIELSLRSSSCRLLSEEIKLTEHAGRSVALETVVATEVHTPPRVALRLILRKR